MWLNLWITFTLDCFLLPYFISKKSLFLPCVFHVPLKNLLINSFDSYQVFVLEDKLFLFGTLCHCEKCRGFGLFVGTLLLWEYAISFFLLCFICHLELILFIIFFLGGMFSQARSLLLKAPFAYLLVFVLLRDSWCDFLKDICIHLIWETVFSKLS